MFTEILLYTNKGISSYSALLLYLYILCPTVILPTNEQLPGGEQCGLDKLLGLLGLHQMELLPLMLAVAVLSSSGLAD